MEEELLFYDAYEEFYTMAKESEIFKEFCKEAYGEDFSQDGFSDINQINKILPYVNEGAEILDIGCGNGKMLMYLKEKCKASIHGFDYSNKAIEYAKMADKEADFEVGIIGEKEYPDESFDVVIAMDSVYFAKDMKALVKQVRRWLKKDGVFFVAYQEGDVMDKTEDENSTVFAKALKEIGWDYEVSDISLESFEMLDKKRKIALKYSEQFHKEGIGMWGDLLIDQTDYILQGKDKYLENLARYIYVCKK
ncbi:MAG: class I SAM-dependent methyltransferase [Lachnospiraceae bacterium]|nr:class I SAM-dependent methyltransferase [Lachnospiraceae bacterium]